MLYAAITSIQPPTPSVRALADRLQACGGKLVVAGDAKGPFEYDLPGVELLTLSDQQAGPDSLANLLPTGHYARKNIAYLHAIRSGATCIYDTDDDNAPIDGWSHRQLTVNARHVEGGDWCNVYRAFTDEHVWPRGYPLRFVHSQGDITFAGGGAMGDVASPIQQGLVNSAPDVDAVWRLVVGDELNFESRPSVCLPANCWCPFNSQSTWWWPEAFALMYLPSFCSFRMTDIWRSFIAQRCLWETNGRLTFHAPEATQDRNTHDLMRDFADEVPGYLRNEEITAVLADLSLTRSDEPGTHMIACYDALIAAGIFPAEERPLVRAWLDDLDVVVGQANTKRN